MPGLIWRAEELNCQHYTGSIPDRIWRYLWSWIAIQGWNTRWILVLQKNLARRGSLYIWVYELINSGHYNITIFLFTRRRRPNPMPSRPVARSSKVAGSGTPSIGPIHPLNSEFSPIPWICAAEKNDPLSPPSLPKPNVCALIALPDEADQ